MTLQELFRKRLIIVTGKGGVGKTTVSLALAFLNAGHKRRAILAIHGQAQKDSSFFGSKKKIDFSERKLDEGVYAIGVDPDKALQEYIRLNFIKAFPLYAAVFKLRAMQNFFEAAPGLKELITIGKIWHLGNLKTKGKVPKPKYDQVIFDAPSTGHALPLFDLPERVLQMVQKGPFRNHVEWVEKSLKNPEETAFVAVTTPEEMAVKETAEIIEGVKSIGLRHAFTVVNRVYPQRFDESDRRKTEDMTAKGKMSGIMPVLISAQSYIRRADASGDHIKQLNRIGAGKLFFVNFRFGSGLTLADAADMSRELERQFGEEI